MNIISIDDYVLLPAYLILVFIVAISHRNRKYKAGSPLHGYYIPALSLKILGALGIGVIYQYYYSAGGDTTHYFLNAKQVARQFNIDISRYFELVFKPISSTTDLRDKIAWTDHGFGYNESNYFPVRVLAVLLLFSFNSYLPAAVLLAYISFGGIWKAYITFLHLYPALHKEFAIAFLFMPSVFFWGSGILKDTLTITALCWLFYSSYLLFILRIRLFKSTFILFLSTLTIVVVKAYVALAFLPALLFWILFQYRSRIKTYQVRVLLLPMLAIVLIAGTLLIISYIGSINERYSLENFLSQAAKFNADNRDAGSAVDIGVTKDMGPLEAMKLAPLAIVAALFRPFIYEAKNIMMLLSALEGTFLLYLSGLIIFRSGLRKAVQVIGSNPLVAFCLMFSIIFAFSVGFSTSNFGTLVRYKIPCIPFFLASLFIILDQSKLIKASEKAR